MTLGWHWRTLVGSPPVGREDLDLLGTIGDLVEDVVVELGGSVSLAADTDAVVRRRRGGSAANVAVAAARISGRSRFVGQVGDDAVGERLVADLEAAGVETRVSRGGRSGTIVVLVDSEGERTMLSDRATCVELDHVDPDWLDGLHTLHVPMYSLVEDPLAASTRRLIGLAHDQGLTVSVDVSSTSIIAELGADEVRDLIESLRPHVMFANEAEAAILASVGSLDSVGAGIVVARRGPGPVSVITGSSAPTEVPAHELHEVRNTTGAGDAFAAGFMTALASGAAPPAAARAGHDAARDVIEHSG